MRKITCYLYRESLSRHWTAATNDLPILSISSMEPEDALRRMQIAVLREVAAQIDDDRQVTERLDLSIVFEIISEADAGRLLNRYDSFGWREDELDP